MHTIDFCLPTVCAWGEQSQAMNLSLPAPDPISFLPSFCIFQPSGHLLMVKSAFCCLSREKQQWQRVPLWRRDCLLSLLPSGGAKLWSSSWWLRFASCHTPPTTANAPPAKSLFQVKTKLTDTHQVRQLVTADFEI